MDLYGQSASVGQANSQIAATQNANFAASDFNNSLAGELDTARAANDEDANTKAQMNMISGVTSGGKLLTSSKAREDLARPTKKLFTFGKEVPVKSSELREGASRGLAEGDDIREGVRAVYAGGARPASPTRLGRGLSEAAVETSEDARAIPSAGAEGSKLVGKGFRFGVESSADVAKTGTLSTKIGEVVAEKGLTGAAKVGLAGIGGGLDIVKDISRNKGVFNKDTYGSNNLQRVGNIGNIVGSGLEVLGLATAWTPFGIGFEGLGAAISVASTVAETAGDIEDAEDTQEKTTADITSQARGQQVSQTVETAVGRSN